jgi:uncharacterized membrane protein YgcG
MVQLATTYHKLLSTSAFNFNLRRYIKGVSWNKQRKKWVAVFKGKTQLGAFATEEAAAQAYDKYVEDGVDPVKRRDDPSSGTSQFKGVCWVKTTGKWRAKCKETRLGHHASEEAAARAYNVEAERLGLPINVILPAADAHGAPRELASMAAQGKPRVHQPHHRRNQSDREDVVEEEEQEKEEGEEEEAEKEEDSREDASLRDAAAVAAQGQLRVHQPRRQHQSSGGGGGGGGSGGGGGGDGGGGVGGGSGDGGCTAAGEVALQEAPHTSQHRGVTWDRHDRKWQVKFRHNMKYIYVGRFDNEEDAARAGAYIRPLFGLYREHCCGICWVV